MYNDSNTSIQVELKRLLIVVKILKIDQLRANLLGAILKVDTCEKKNTSKEKFNTFALDVIKKQCKKITDLRRREQASLYKYVGELERTHPHFNQK